MDKMALFDPYGRTINYLRLSVTDRCNLRCQYCMPAAGVAKMQHADLLSYEELLRVAAAAVAIGVEKIRITGGEPLVRKGIVGFLARLAKLPGLKRLVLTTNGILLPEMAQLIRNAGVESLNISLDSLRPDTFRSITRGGDLARVLAGIAAAERAGFPFVKINVVVMRGINDHEVADFAAMTMNRPYRVRFIEYMPTNPESGWESLSISGEELLAGLAGQYRLKPVPKGSLDGPSVSYRIEGGVGTVGVITPVTCHFCHECNRIRVTSTGKTKSCLFGGEQLDLKPVLMTGDQAALQEALRRVVNSKPSKHSLLAAGKENSALLMSQVGG